MTDENTRLCIKCGQPAARERGKLTLKTPDEELQCVFLCCCKCGPLLQAAVMNTYQKWKENK